MHLSKPQRTSQSTIVHIASFSSLSASRLNKNEKKKKKS